MASLREHEQFQTAVSHMAPNQVLESKALEMGEGGWGVTLSQPI